MIKNSKFYDLLKWIAQVVLPGLGTFYFSLSDLWNLPEPDRVVGTIVIIDTFLGVLLHQSSKAYKNSADRFDGSIDKTDDGEKSMVSINVEGDPLKVLDDKDELLLKVNREEPLGVVAPAKPKKRVAKKAAKKS